MSLLGIMIQDYKDKLVREGKLPKPNDVAGKK